MRLLSLPGRWPRVATWAARCKGMSDVAKQRLKAIQFADRHGIAAAADHAGVTGRTIYRWKALLRDGGPDALEIQPRKPRRRPPSRWPPEIVEEIRRLRTDHPNLGKRKIHPLLTRFCQERGLVCPAVVTIGRLIARAGGMRMIPPRLDNRGRKKRPRPPKPRKPKGYRPKRPGELIAVDTVHRIDTGIRRYLFAAIDVRSRFAMAVASPGLGTGWSSAFLDVVLDIFPAQVERILSDNGSEFEGLFRKRVEKLGLGRMFTYPKTPQMNAHVERFNRTLQEDFVDFHEDLLWAGEDGLAEFNRRLADWLLWYNTERPHQALDGEVPLAVLAREAEPREDRPLYRPPPPPPPDTPASALVAGSRRTSPRRSRLGKPPPPPGIPLCQQGWARTTG